MWKEQSFGEKGDRLHFPEAPGREEAGGGRRGEVEKVRETLGGRPGKRPARRRTGLPATRRGAGSADVSSHSARDERFRSRARSVDRPLTSVTCRFQIPVLIFLRHEQEGFGLGGRRGTGSVGLDGGPSQRRAAEPRARVSQAGCSTCCRKWTK